MFKQEEFRLTDYYSPDVLDDYTKFSSTESLKCEQGLDGSNSNKSKEVMLKGEDPMLNMEQIQNSVLDLFKQAQQRNGDSGSEWSLTEWKRKPVVKWSVRDTLAWMYAEAENYNTDFMDTNMPSFSMTSGSQLIGMTEEDFFRRIPDMEFARHIYTDLQKLIQIKLEQHQQQDNSSSSYMQSSNYDIFTSAQEFLPNSFMEGPLQAVPINGYNPFMDLSQNSSLYELTPDNGNKLQEGFEPLENDSGIEDIGYDSEHDKNQLQHGHEYRYRLQEGSSGDIRDWSALCLSSQFDKVPVVETRNSGGDEHHLNDEETSNLSYSGSAGYESHEDDDEEMETTLPETSAPAQKKKGPGRPRGIKRKKPEKLGRLWEFIRDLLKDERYCPTIICWEDYEKGIFRFVQSEKVAKLWGKKKDNPEMTFEKFSRAMRYYYKSQVLIAVQRRLVYQFGPKATNWRSERPILRGQA